MYSFGSRSNGRLGDCHSDLQRLLDLAIKQVDFTVLCGHRDEIQQSDAFHEGRSKVDWPDSKHNSLPSLAVDIAPYPIDWQNITRFAHLIGIVKGIAASEGIEIRCGCDWDMDGDVTDHSFMDWPHIELV